MVCDVTRWIWLRNQKLIRFYIKWRDAVLAGYNCKRVKNIYFRFIGHNWKYIEWRKYMIENTDQMNIIRFAQH